MFIYERLSILVIISAISASSCLPADADPLPCNEEFRDSRGISVDELVNMADNIVFATAANFVADGSKSPYDGYYTFSPLLELKGDIEPQIKVWGGKPYKRIPQSYIDITDVHSALNVDRLYGGSTGIIETKDECFLNPRFVIGWNYLVFLGVNSELAFEPIHSPDLDAWYHAVEKSVMNNAQ